MVHKYADPDTAMFRGEIGKLGNIRFIETSEAKIWKDSTCPDGLAVFGTLVLGAHAYGVTELEGGGLEHIVKQLGYGDDPLNQRASVGWKGMRAAGRLVEQYMVRIERVQLLCHRCRQLRRCPWLKRTCASGCSRTTAATRVICSSASAA